MSRRPTETKSRILLSARNLFSNYGYTATSLDDILDAAGITKGAFYHYFRGKEHLCQAMIEEIAEEYRKLADSIDKTISPAEQLKTWLTLLIERNLSGQWVNCRLITRLSVQIQQLCPETQGQLTAFWQWCDSLYQNWLIGCRIPTDQAKIEARTLISIMCGSLWLDKASIDSPPLSQVVDHHLRMILPNQS